MRQDRVTEWALVAFGVPVVVWLALLLAPVFTGAPEQILAGLAAVMAEPWRIEIVEGSLKAALLGLGAYALGIGIFFSTRRNWRRREEHGSAQWGQARTIASHYRDGRYLKNRLLTKNFRMGLDDKRHKRNLNVMVVGGSGSGKTRGYALPNVMQANSSMIILDPKAEIVKMCGHLLEHEGFEVRILDLINMEKSHRFNPFFYLHTDNDTQRLVTNLFKATTPKGAVSQDPFWDTAASMLLLALMFYLLHEAPADEQNFPMVMEMLRVGEVREEDDEFCSILDELFDELRYRDPDHIALKYYDSYHSGSAKTLKSIQVTLASRLEKFNLASLSALTTIDELDLPSLGEKKVALFALIPDNDNSFNFLVSILYTQLFQQLFSLADSKYDGTLPVHVHFVLDEFANVALPDDFEKILSVMRSRNISVSIILQNIAQLKALFEKQHESITGNCDSFLYLGGNEQATHKAVSEMLGKATIDTNTYGRTTGYQGNYSTNWQITGRELLTPDEVRMLDNRYALLFVRGERPIQDEKYNIATHPHFHLTTGAGKPPYRHGLSSGAATSIAVGLQTPASKEAAYTSQEHPGSKLYELLCEDDLAEIYHLND
ncbi:MAG: type IV secretory system conjugative DNA transfer family protein [Coriobacteriales bacterium]|jgi:type IV secretion system protein VirD4|nr:type IV secretory system conjugative DNA transfer family protein [Coriobacteriales bacterium]